MKKIIIGAAGLAMAAAGIVGIAAPASAYTINPAGYDDCYYAKGGEASACILAEPVKGKAMKTKYWISGAFSQAVMADPAMAGQQVCIYRVAQPGAGVPETEIAACGPVNASNGQFRFYVKLGFPGVYSYNVGPKKIKWNKGNPMFTPDVQLKTTKN